MGRGSAAANSVTDACLYFKHLNHVNINRFLKTNKTKPSCSQKGSGPRPPARTPQGTGAHRPHPRTSARPPRRPPRRCARGPEGAPGLHRHPGRSLSRHPQGPSNAPHSRVPGPSFTTRGTLGRGLESPRGSVPRRPETAANSAEQSAKSQASAFVRTLGSSYPAQPLAPPEPGPTDTPAGSRARPTPAPLPRNLPPEARRGRGTLPRRSRPRPEGQPRPGRSGKGVAGEGRGRGRGRERGQPRTHVLAVALARKPGRRRDKSADGPAGRARANSRANSRVLPSPLWEAGGRTR